jgi:hypothetical protein
MCGRRSNCSGEVLIAAVTDGDEVVFEAVERELEFGLLFMMAAGLRGMMPGVLRTGNRCD